MQFKSATRVAQQVTQLRDAEFSAAPEFNQPGLVPQIVQSGPLVFVSGTEDPYIAWRATWALVLGPVALARDTYERLRLVRTSRVAQLIYEV